MKDKLKKLLIPIIIVIVVLIMIGCVLFKYVLTDKAKNEDKNNIENNEVNTVDTNYTAYISINPLIKLTFKVSCKDNVCSEPLVIDYELVNDDAKEIYNDIDFSKTNGELSNVLLLIAQTARDSEVEFNTVDVYSDYSIINDYIDDHEEIINISKMFHLRDDTVNKKIKSLIEEFPFLEKVFLYAFTNYSDKEVYALFGLNKNSISLDKFYFDEEKVKFLVKS